MTAVSEVVISIDSELSWGYHDLETAPARLNDARRSWHTTLDLLRTHDVPATWSIVGHLMLDHCDGSHEDHPLGPSWFPCGAAAAGSGDWLAPDLVDAVRLADQGHEIASHTFSHVVMDTVDRDVAVREFAESKRLADRAGIDLRSVVFPRNRVAHLDVLAEHGFTCYRGVQPARWYATYPLQPLWKLADWSPLGAEPPLVTPTLDEHGLVNVPASFYLFSFEGLARRAAGAFGQAPVVAVAKRGIEKAIERDGLFHVYFHPHNVLQPDGEERLDAILGYLARRRAETDLRVRTMAEVAREVRAEQGR